MLMRPLARIALVPLLLVQGLWVRAGAQFLPEPPGDRGGVFGSGPDLGLLVLGDSSAAGVGAQNQKTAMPAQLVFLLAQNARVHYRVEAITGATSRSTLKSMDTVTYGSADLCIVVLGVNDVTRATSPRRFVRNLARIEAALKSKTGTRHIIFSGVPPMGHFPLLPNPLRWVLGQDAQRLDAALQAFCAESQDRSHLPLDLPLTPDMVASDGFHPSETAHALWAKMLARHILDVLPMAQGSDLDLRL
uniref:SGNH/GDSL hydrolase family protein n=1 Tax=Shimia biformata TaxID=1294299 RepID=UPI00194F6B78|nr:SGNH/GDSL hydrolase family protein [Shimia biformata]